MSAGDGDPPPAPGAEPDPRWRRLLVRLVEASAVERFLISFAALLLSIAVGTVIVLVAGRTATCEEAAFTLISPVLQTPWFATPELFRLGFCYDPVTVFDRLFLGALADPLRDNWQPLSGQLSPFRPGWDPLDPQIAITLRETTVLAFTGVAVAVAFRAGIFNIGTQGQMVVGALASTLAVLAVAPLVGGLLGTLVLVPLGLVVGGLFGGFYGAIPGALKAYADANEVITTIMLNFVATGVVFFLVDSYFTAPDTQSVETASIPAYGRFPSVVFDPRVDFSLVALAFALAMLVGVYLLLEHTSFGFDLRTSGIQPEAAEYGGVDAARTIVSSMAISGALGGIAGAVYVLTIAGKFETGFPAYGFDGITVSILAGNNPLGVAAAAFLFGVLKSGTTVVQFATDVPPQLVGVLRGLIVLFVAMPEFFRMLGKRTVGRRRGQPREAVAADGGEPDE
jgi:simple sugar transport system permease protein